MPANGRDLTKPQQVDHVQMLNSRTNVKSRETSSSILSQLETSRVPFRSI